ncbi:hypothetical protein GL297_13920 [Komagataeibacter sp. FXV2]|nr:hypothetical protein [Komagataeibacter sp. FXV2]
MREGFQPFPERVVIEAPFTFGQEKVKVLPRYSIASPQMALRLVPEGIFGRQETACCGDVLSCDISSLYWLNYASPKLL